MGITREGLSRRPENDKGKRPPMSAKGERLPVASLPWGGLGREGTVLPVVRFPRELRRKLVLSNIWPSVGYAALEPLPPDRPDHLAGLLAKVA